VKEENITKQKGNELCEIKIAREGRRNSN